MIVLISYQGNKKRKINQVDTFKLWHFFYKTSGTEMPFRIFTNPESTLDNLEGFPLTKLPKSPPCSIDSLTYGDWLRSELYNAVQQPCIYMDMDAFILQPIDDSYFDFEGTLGMTQKSILDNKHFNCGLIVFKKDFSSKYQKMFLENKNKHPKHVLYGQQIWSDIMLENGYNMSLNFHCTYWNMVEGSIPREIKILHLTRELSIMFLQISQLLKNSIEQKNFPIDLESFKMP